MTRAVSLASDQSVEEIIDQAIGRALTTGVDYLSNFRQGKIARAKAKLIHAWIPDHLANYIDMDAIAGNLAFDYTETQIAGERLIYWAG